MSNQEKKASLIKPVVRLWMKARSAPLLTVGLLIISTVVIMAIFAPFISPLDPNQIRFDQRLLAPSPDHWLGTDELGRDIWTRLLYGARISLSISVVVVLIATTGGLLIGATVGYLGGWIDTLVMRCVDVLIAIPGLVLAMALTAALGPSLQNAMIALAFVAMPSYIRLIRGQARVTRHLEFTEAAVSFGASRTYIVRVHIIPSCLPIVLVQGTLDVGGMILAAAALSFLGLGAQPPLAEWGAMVSAGRQFLMTHWWYPTVPGMAILISAIGFNLVGDGLRDWLDPRGNSKA